MNLSMMKTLGCLALTLLFLGVSVHSGVAGVAERAPWSTAETHRVAEAATYRSRDSSSEDLQRFGWYAGLHIGAVVMPDMEIRGPGLAIDVINRTGYNFSAVFGYKLRLGLRLETEVSYRNNDTDSIYAPATKVLLDNGIGGTEAVTAMLNAWYDIDFLNRSWSPYFGFGFGHVNVWTDPGYWNSINLLDSSADGLAWQVGGGIIFYYTRDLNISIDYRFLRTVTELEFHDIRYAGTNDAFYQTHSFMLGFRGFF